MTDPPAIGIDIGGTKVSGALVQADGTISHRIQRDTPHRTTSPSVVHDTIVGVVNDVLAVAEQDRPDGPTQRRHVSVAAIGIGAAGWVSADQSTVVFAPHLSWRNEPLGDRLSISLSLPVVVDNDANAAGWAEWRFGAGRGERHLVMITLGTGIGGALVVNGQIQRGKFGLAGEFGHMQVVSDGHRCACGNRGCWEEYASGRALIREARAIMDLVGRGAEPGVRKGRPRPSVSVWGELSAWSETPQDSPRSGWCRRLRRSRTGWCSPSTRGWLRRRWRR